MKGDIPHWQYADGGLLYQDDFIRVVVKGKIRYDSNFAKLYCMNPFIFEEWMEYRVVIHDKESDRRYDKKDANVLFGGHAAYHDEDGTFWSFVFKNYVGKSSIEILARNYLPLLNIEVISPKLSLNKDDELFYPDFCRGLIESLKRYQLTLPFEITSPTFISVEDVPVPPNPLILLYQIIANSSFIVDGINTILINPHRDLITEELFVNLHEAEKITPDVCISIVCSPEQLVKSKSTSLPIVSKLKGHIPEKILQSRNIETFDTPENRFVKSFIKELLQSMHQIEDLGILDKETLNRIGNKWSQMKTACEVATLSECFQEVSDGSFLPPLMSQILLKKEGYGDILRAHNELLLSKSPIFTYLNDKINERNIAEMYEFWCFFELSTRLANFFNINHKLFKIRVETTLKGGLADSKAKTTLGDLQLLYNKKFYRSKKGSYSVPLKPDFSLQEDDEVVVAFDAKFRFLESGEDISEDVPLEDDEEKALKDMKIERVADIADIFKMHTYKDALGAKSAVILYPGNTNVFFSKGSKEKIQGTFEQVFEKICGFEEGIAYLAFVPRRGLS